MKTKIAIIAAAVMLSSSAIAGDAGGTVSFSGNVVDVSCTINVDGHDADHTVILPSVYADELKNTVPAKLTDFTISVTDCRAAAGGVDNTGLNHVKVRWSEAQLFNGKYLNNLAADSEKAQNVYLALYHKDNPAVIIPGAENNNNTLSQTYKGDTLTFDYSVAYITDDAASATGGKVAGAAIYTVSYD